MRLGGLLSGLWSECVMMIGKWSDDKGAGTPDYYPLYTALTTFYSDYFVGGLWANLTTIRTCIFLYFAYLQG